ncbi:hypothetical protein AR457_16465 [Streptomyces agglomeratus]|uniref:DUF6303 family protein n=1 Tax=Streptomyces agglomeratus TaxID=285458 RepID=UPI00085449D4|nr:DUF6303 family protein [Streptomyces agglomeratus]OEJ40133.1 hypothetical protein BGK70_20185 [Streptomyces agglomeratus]OEJ45487.1 hypothetical protein AR457_16465 [Streptomyces agglomeratus]
MATMFTAQMAVSQTTGRWRLYVVLLGVPVSQWPERDFGHGAAVPTVAERSRALHALGYTFTDGTEWEWTETSDTVDDASSPVRLIASITVGEAAR